MEREHAVNTQITNNGECICNPEILLGTKYGLWDFEKEVAPRGTLLDLNAAWELFLSRKGLSNLSFEEEYHHQHEVDEDGNVYEDGDTTYTLIDDYGNPTNATFTIKANKGPVEHIEWQDGNLILYYTKTRPVTQADIDSGVPLHYVLDEQGQQVIDEETGQPLIYDYVKIPVIEIFDNDETHTLFPWFADDQHTVRLRQTLDDPDNPNSSHLGDFAIASDSEVFFAKQRYAQNEGNTLVSAQSILNQLQTTLGVNFTYETTQDLTDEEGNSIHQRATGNTLGTELDTTDKTSIVDAINEVSSNGYDAIALVSGEKRTTPIPLLDNYLQFNPYLLSHNYPFTIGLQNVVTGTLRNVLDTINNLQHFDLGDFQDVINSNIFGQGDNKNITVALNNIFAEAEENRARIGYQNNNWITLTTDSTTNLTSAINEIEQQKNAIAAMIPLTERVNIVDNTYYYTNDQLNQITTELLRPSQQIKNDTTIIEDINKLQEQIGNLASDNVRFPTKLRTDAKGNLVYAINEVDTHADNNFETIGAVYTTNVSTGEKTSNITNLTTEDQTSIVNAINELVTKIGSLDSLPTDDQDSVVDSIEEVVAEQPFVYQDTSNKAMSGVVLKDRRNTAGINTFVFGYNNSGTGLHSLVTGDSNNSSGQYSAIFGNSNIERGQFNFIHGGSNNVAGGQSTTVFGYGNTTGHGVDNVIIGNNNINSNFASLSSVDYILGNNNTVWGDHVYAIGSNNQLGEYSKSFGETNILNGYDYTIGSDNTISSNHSYVFGRLNNISAGSNNDGINNYVLGKDNVVIGSNNYVFGIKQKVTGVGNIIIGKEDVLKAYGTTGTPINNAVIINGINTVHNNSTHIGKDIYIQTHDSESKLQSLIFVDLNDWCRWNASNHLNGQKFLDTTHVVQAIQSYISQSAIKGYTDSALLRFKMQDNDENGLAIIQGNSIRVYLNGSWYFTDDIQRGWSRHEGTYLKVISKSTTDLQGNTVIKKYLAFKDQLSTTDNFDTVGAQRSGTPDFGDIDLTHAYGAIDIDDIANAMELTQKLNNKVDKSARIITKYRQPNGQIVDQIQNFIDPNNDSISADIVLDLYDQFGLNVNDYQKRSEKGQPSGYVPLNASGVIDSQYLPSYVDDVIDVWAEYQVDSLTGAVTNVHLYEIENSVVPSTGEEVIVKGTEIVTGEQGKIYVEAQPSANRRFIAQFRWTGTQWVATGFSNIVIGEVTGTAFDGGRGVALEDDFEDHVKSGTTSIMDNGVSVIYKPNPHNVTPDQLPITVDDPNDPQNTNADVHYTRSYNVKTAIQTLFDRLNTEEDRLAANYNILGTSNDFYNLDMLDNIQNNNTPTVISVLLNTKENIDSFVRLSTQQITTSVTSNFKLYGED